MIGRGSGQNAYLPGPLRGCARCLKGYVILAAMAPFSVYLHIPFCRHKCSYCDFNTYAGLESLVGDYVRALIRETAFFAASAGSRLPVHTIFLGGGTPSLLPVAALREIFAALETEFAIQAEPEITLEANPGTLSLAYLRDLRALGINRLSLGMQSARPEELALLEREHGFPEVVQAVTWARQAGFEQVSLDLIFGLPYQSLRAWQQSLELALGLHPDHLSLYALSLEHGTPLGSWVARGLVSQPDPDLAAEMYEWAAARLFAKGFIQYEISNWARAEGSGTLLACRHNLQYWRNEPYIGLGAGAHGFVGGFRTANVLAPAKYIQRCLEGAPGSFPRTPATASAVPVNRQVEMQETMLMGLRLTREGVSDRAFSVRFGRSIREAFPAEVRELLEAGLLEWGGEGADILRLTPPGRLLGNQVFVHFV